MDEKHRLCESVIPRSSLHIVVRNRQMNASQGEDNETILPNDGIKSGILTRRNVNVDDGQADGQMYCSSSEGSQVGTPCTKDLKKQTSRVEDCDNDDGNDDDDNDDGQVSGASNLHTDLYSVGRCKDINIRLESNSSTCDVMDMCVLSDGRILLSDFKNDKLNRLDFNSKKIRQYDIKSTYGPLCICMINDTEAAVVVDDSIRVVSLEDNEETNMSIKIGHSCRGVAYCDGELYVSNGCRNIHVYTLEGEKLRTFKTGPKETYYWEYEWLTIRSNGSRLYFTNWKHGIVCLDRQSGAEMWRVEDTDNNGYRGICEDRYNNVFVCRYEKNDVVQFSPDGQLTGVVIDKLEGLEKPQSICIDEFMGRIIVGMRSNNVIKIFDLKS